MFTSVGHYVVTAGCEKRQLKSLEKKKLYKGEIYESVFSIALDEDSIVNSVLKRHLEDMCFWTAIRHPVVNAGCEIKSLEEKKLYKGEIYVSVFSISLDEDSIIYSVLKHQLECTLYFTYIDCFGPPFLEQDTYQMSFEGFKEKIKDDFKVIDFLNNDDNYFLCLKRFLDGNFTILPVEEPIYVRPNECIIKRSIYVQSDEHLQVNINNKVYKTKDII